jgi:hypothetical protein
MPSTVYFRNNLARLKFARTGRRVRSQIITHIAGGRVAFLTKWPARGICVWERDYRDIKF